LFVLENTYRSRAHPYNRFCSEIVRRRLRESGLDDSARVRLDDYFEEPTGLLEERAVKYTREKIDVGTDPPWIERVYTELCNAGREVEARRLLPEVRFPESPLHEKFAVLLAYRSWADGEPLVEVAASNRMKIEQLSAGILKRGKLATAYKHNRADLYAQLLAELRLPQEYYGFQHFVRMSGYLPRNLLVVLKQVTRWSLFLAEKPFRGERISLRAQREGVREASAWFLSDAKGLGRLGEETQLAVRRLASLFRDMRFAQKPVEVSCSAFATDRQGLAPGAARALDEAVSHSLILEVPSGRREKNTRILQHKYQLNPMLAPLFDLSLALRGAASFSPSDLNGILDPEASDAAFGMVRRKLLSRMVAPFQDTQSRSRGLFD
jgi:hypothetical protein